MQSYGFTSTYSTNYGNNYGNPYRNSLNNLPYNSNNIPQTFETKPQNKYPKYTQFFISKNLETFRQDILNIVLGIYNFKILPLSNAISKKLKEEFKCEWFTLISPIYNINNIESKKVFDFYIPNTGLNDNYFAFSFDDVFIQIIKIEL